MTKFTQFGKTSTNVNKNDYTKEPEIHLHATEARWFAIYTKYKREKLVHKELQTKGIESYLPLQTHIRVYTRKRKKVELPLISCYLFVKITKPEYVPVLEVDDVVKFVRFSKNMIAIPDQEIQLLRQIVGEGLPIVAEKLALRKGDMVEIIGGNLTGIRGVLVEEHGEKEMVIDLDNMGYSLRMQIDSKLLKKV